MFGIIMPYMEGLEESEQERYREVYCGICQSLKRRHSQVSRVCVNYDMVLLALLRESLFEHGETTSSARCVAHPTTPQSFVQGDEVDYAADMSVMFAYHKCVDDWNDDGRTSARAYSGLLSRSYDRVKTAFPMQCAAAETELSSLNAIEAELLASSADESGSRENALSQSDAIAKRFGAVMSCIFARDAGFWEADLAQFGAELGRFVYFMDAAIDREDDRKSGSFNPFNLCGTADEDVELLLTNLLGRAIAVFERLPLERDLNLMRCILYSGVWQRLREQQHEEDEEGDE